MKNIQLQENESGQPTPRADKSEVRAPCDPFDAQEENITTSACIYSFSFKSQTCNLSNM